MTHRPRRAAAQAAILFLLLAAARAAHGPSVTYVANEGVMITAPGTAVRDAVRPRHVVALHLPVEPRERLAALRAEFPQAHTFDRELAVWPVPRCG